MYTFYSTRARNGFKINNKMFIQPRIASNVFIIYVWV